MKRTALMTIAALTLIAAMAAGCATKTAESSASDTAASQESQEPGSESVGFYFTINGIKLSTGIEYDEVKDKLGQLTKPAEKYEPCDPAEEESMVYDYEGFTVETKMSGTIDCIRVGFTDDKGGNIPFADSIKIGDSIDQVKAKLGEPGKVEDDNLIYNKNGRIVYIGYIADTGLVDTFTMYNS